MGKNIILFATINAWTYAQFEDDGNLPIIILKALINKIKPNKITKFDVVYNVGAAVSKGISKKYKKEKELFNLYCNIMKDLNVLSSLSPNTLYAIVARERATGGHLNKL